MNSKALQADSVAKGIIVGHVNDLMMLTLSMFGRAYDMYGYLKEVYTAKAEDRQAELVSQLYSTKMSGNGSLQSHLETMLLMRKQLQLKQQQCHGCYVSQGLVQVSGPTILELQKQSPLTLVQEVISALTTYDDELPKTNEGQAAYIMEADARKFGSRLGHRKGGRVEKLQFHPNYSSATISALQSKEVAFVLFGWFPTFGTFSSPGTPACFERIVNGVQRNTGAQNRHIRFVSFASWEASTVFASPPSDSQRMDKVARICSGLSPTMRDAIAEYLLERDDGFSGHVNTVRNTFADEQPRVLSLGVNVNLETHKMTEAIQTSEFVVNEVVGALWNGVNEVSLQDMGLKGFHCDVSFEA
ncbi:hypothetical protein V1506DRAFT_516342 [Lipomyces tetrasporus]